jgi:hypothetical protein
VDLRVTNQPTSDGRGAAAPRVDRLRLRLLRPVRRQSDPRPARCRLSSNRKPRSARCAAGKRVIVTQDCLYDGIPADKLVAVWIHASTRSKPSKRRFPRFAPGSSARGLSCPIMAYLDAHEWSRLTEPGARLVQPHDLLQGRRVARPVQGAHAVQTLATFPSNAVITLMCQAYDTNDSLTRDLLPIQYVFPELARSDARVRGIFWFSDGRVRHEDGSRRHSRASRRSARVHAMTVAAVTGCARVRRAWRRPPRLSPSRPS